MPLTSYDLAGPDPNPMTCAEVDALKALAEGAETIIQIGAERGCSTVALLEAAPDAFIFSIDCGVRQEEFDNVRKAALETNNVVRGLGRSQSIGVNWPQHWTCDLLYIDGDHRYNGVYQDLTLWPRFVRDGGIIALHDYIPPDRREPKIVGRVWEAVQEWLKYTDYEQILRVDRLVAFRK